jgi:hypothetical protein
MLGWTDIYVELPPIGSKVMARLADDPGGNSGRWVASIEVVGLPELGEDWPVPSPNGTAWVRYWRYMQ